MLGKEEEAKNCCGGEGERGGGGGGLEEEVLEAAGWWRLYRLRRGSSPGEGERGEERGKRGEAGAAVVGAKRFQASAASPAPAPLSRPHAAAGSRMTVSHVYGGSPEAACSEPKAYAFVQVSSRPQGRFLILASR